MVTSRRTRLLDIHAFIAADAPRAAQRVAAELEALADSLYEMPARGRRLGPDLNVRELVAGRYLIRYRVVGRTVLIVRLKHSAQSG